VRFIKALLILAVSFSVFAERTPVMAQSSSNNETATLGGGCFWCMEAVFQELEGVSKVESGYAGGIGEPDYKEVCTGKTGHAEVIQIHFNPQVTTYDEILAVYFTIHDPTTLNRQGADVGTQYRSVIFYESESQKSTATSVLRELVKDKVYDDPIVTQVAPLDIFYRAEDYHQDYYSRNRTQGYCRAIIDPKVKKFREKFSSKSKKR